MSVITLAPRSELAFKINANGQCEPLELVITNISEKGRNVTFKIKTTSPDSYIVKPNAGVIGPRDFKSITITPSTIPSQTASHKFMV